MLILALTGLLLGSMIDERQEAKRRLEEQEERTGLIRESTAEGIYGIDCSGACTFMDAAGMRILGFASPSEALGKNVHRVCHHLVTTACDTERGMPDLRGVPQGTWAAC